MSVELELSAPIEAYGDIIRKLVFRAPIGKDFRSCGFPLKFHMGEDGNFAEPNTPAIHAYIARLANIPPGSVDAMSFNDMNAAMNVVLDFFGEKTSSAMPSTVTMTSRGNGNGTLIESSTSPIPS